MGWGLHLAFSLSKRLRWLGLGQDEVRGPDLRAWSLRLHLGLAHGGQDPSQALKSPSAVSPSALVGVGLKVEQPGHKPAFIWDASIICGHLAHCVTTLPPLHFFYDVR